MRDSALDRHAALFAGSDLGELILRFDWRRTGLGPIADWPAHLRVATR